MYHFYRWGNCDGVVLCMVNIGYEMIDQGFGYGKVIFMMTLAQVGYDSLRNQTCNNWITMKDTSCGWDN